jgi:hypothetical protein
MGVWILLRVGVFARFIIREGTQLELCQRFGIKPDFGPMGPISRTSGVVGAPIVVVRVTPRQPTAGAFVG